MKKHLGDLIYSCGMCDEKFRTQVEVRRHMLVHGPADKVGKVESDEMKEIESS